MNSQRDLEEFMRKLKDVEKESSTNIQFSVYKSKADRITQNSLLKKYNTFNDNPSGANSFQPGVYKSYNDLVPGTQQSSNTNSTFPK